MGVSSEDLEIWLVTIEVCKKTMYDWDSDRESPTHPPIMQRSSTGHGHYSVPCSTLSITALAVNVKSP